MSVLIEKHKSDCTCSYCKGILKMGYGLEVPLDWKVWNSWWVIKFWPRCYLRWTNSWLRKF